ncbi:RDD family protein [candidate division KSB1 bacterium]|nr:RDD family protein [candidate division KSB1 bacterium]
MESKNLYYAGFWRRYAAYIIDYVIIFYVYLSFVSFLTSILHNQIIELYSTGDLEKFIYPFYHLPYPFNLGIFPSDNPEAFYFMANRISFFVLLPLLPLYCWCYFAGLESGPLQATFGKMATGLYVTDKNGDRLSFARASGRFFGKCISNIFQLVFYGLAGWTSNKQALHDMMAGCLVLRR